MFYSKLKIYWKKILRNHLLDVSSKAIVASLIIDHTVNFALSGNSHGPCNLAILFYSILSHNLGRSSGHHR